MNRSQLLKEVDEVLQIAERMGNETDAYYHQLFNRFRKFMGIYCKMRCLHIVSVFAPQEL